MSKIIFNFGTMNASKTAQMLMVNHNYEEKGVQPILIKPSIDNRGEYPYQIYSRVGLTADADFVDGSDILDWNELERVYQLNGRPSAILVDEAQFIQPETIVLIAEFARFNQINVFAYGLLKDFRNELFLSSQVWLQESDNFTEIKTSCRFCERKATINARIIDNKIVKEGPTILIGMEESYASVCRKHYDYYSEFEIKP